MYALLTSFARLSLIHAGPRLQALHHKYAVFTYSLANIIFAAKQRAYAASSACCAACSSIHKVLAHGLSSLARVHAEDAQELAGHWLAATVACAVLALAWRAINSRRKTLLAAA